MKILKYIIAVLVLTSTTISFSQKKKFVVGSPSFNVLYKGFDNLVEIGFAKKKTKYTVECIGCDTIIKVKSSNNLYVLKPGIDSIPEVVLHIKNKSGELLQTVKYKSLFVPKPTIIWGKLNGFDTIDSLQPEVKLYLKKSIDFSIWYSIQSWKITLGNRTFVGERNQLSTEVLEFMKKVKSGVVLVELKYIDPVLRKKGECVKEVFILNL